MSTSLTFNPDQHRTLDRPVREIEVHLGSLLITAEESPELVQEGERYEAANTASLTLYSPSGATVEITYSDESNSAIPTEQTLQGEVEAAELVRERIDTTTNPSTPAEEAAKETAIRDAEARVHQAERRLRSFYPPKKRKPKKKETIRGDKGGSTGSYESRTRDELRKLAKEREIPGYSELNKGALIDALRA